MKLRCFNQMTMALIVSASFTFSVAFLQAAEQAKPSESLSGENEAEKSKRINKPNILNNRVGQNRQAEDC
jgi:hypothetical protein